jgi:peroxiredoxin
MKITGLLAIAAVGLAACNQNNQVPVFTVNGTFNGTNATKIYLAELPFGSTERTVVDTAMLDAKGHFELSTPSKGEGIYQLFVENGPGLMLINDADRLTVAVDAAHLEQSKVEGGKANADLKNLYTNFLMADSLFQQRRKITDSLYQDKKQDSAFGVARQQLDAAITDVQAVLSNFILTEPNGTAVYFALRIAQAYNPAEKWDALLESSMKRFPEHPGIALLKLPPPQQPGTEQKQGQQLVGKPVPNISLPDTTGKTMAVSDFKGKWLLVDFWSSWCGPCRAENPNVVAAYNQFKGKNFDILGISLDKTKEAWTKAIRQDGLRWNHISDLKYWDSQAVSTYGFNAIPFNMLVSPDGKVVATDLRGDELVQALQQYVK